MLKRLRGISQTGWIFIGMTIGVLIGFYFPSFGIALKPYGSLFITMIKAIIAPLVFSTLVVGITGTGNMKTVGRIGMKAMIYFEVVTTAALFIGLFAVNLVKPGVGINVANHSGGQLPGIDPAAASAQSQSITGIIQHLFTPSIIDSMAKGEVLQIVVFAVIFAAGVIAVGQRAKPVIELCEAVSEVMFKFTGYIMYFAPIGVGSAIAAVVGEHGLSVLVNLGKLILTLYGSLIVFAVGVLLPVAYLFRVPIRKFLAAVKEPTLIAFSTTSSEAALPKAMENMEGIGVPRSIVGFVMPVGYSFNLAGSTLYLALAAIFVAQAVGKHMSISQQLIMMVTLMITSKGVAGVPRATLVILAGTLASFGLPVEALLVILGVDSIMDMARSAINVLGNCLATVVVARWEGAMTTVSIPETDPVPIVIPVEAANEFSLIES